MPFLMKWIKIRSSDRVMHAHAYPCYRGKIVMKSGETSYGSWSSWYAHAFPTGGCCRAGMHVHTRVTILALRITPKVCTCIPFTWSACVFMHLWYCEYALNCFKSCFMHALQYFNAHAYRTYCRNYGQVHSNRTKLRYSDRVVHTHAYQFIPHNCITIRWTMLN